MTEKRSAAERRNEILQAALHVFVRKGYAQTRMEDIVTQSGLSKGALYWHYKSKRDLFLDLIDHWMDRFAPLMRPGYHQHKSASKILEDICRFTVRVFKRDEDWFLAELELWAWAARDEEILERGRKLVNRMLEEFKAVLESGIRRGEFRSDIDVDLVALLLLNTLQGMVWFVLFQPLSFTVDQYVKMGLEAILAQIQKEPSEKGDSGKNE